MKNLVTISDYNNAIEKVKKAQQKVDAFFTITTIAIIIAILTICSFTVN